jgi:hypothetical protein
MATSLAFAIGALEGSLTRPLREAFVDWARQTGEKETRKRTRSAGPVRMWLNLAKGIRREESTLVH